MSYIVLKYEISVVKSDLYPAAQNCVRLVGTQYSPGFLRQFPIWPNNVVMVGVTISMHKMKISNFKNAQNPLAYLVPVLHLSRLRDDPPPFFPNEKHKILYKMILSVLTLSNPFSGWQIEILVTYSISYWLLLPRLLFQSWSLQPAIPWSFIRKNLILQSRRLRWRSRIRKVTYSGYYDFYLNVFNMTPEIELVFSAIWHGYPRMDAVHNAHLIRWIGTSISAVQLETCGYPPILR